MRVGWQRAPCCRSCHPFGQNVFIALGLAGEFARRILRFSLGEMGRHSMRGHCDIFPPRSWCLQARLPNKIPFRTLGLVDHTGLRVAVLLLPWAFQSIRRGAGPRDPRAALHWTTAMLTHSVGLAMAPLVHRQSRARGLGRPGNLGLFRWRSRLLPTPLSGWRKTFRRIGT